MIVHSQHLQGDLTIGGQLEDGVDEVFGVIRVGDGKFESHSFVRLSRVHNKMNSEIKSEYILHAVVGLEGVVLF